MKKLIKISLILTLALASLPVSSSFADEASGVSKKTEAASDAAANAAKAASAGGINSAYIEAGVFFGAIGLMAAAIASSPGVANTQPTAHAHGH